jgi:hypothetical protein
MAVERYKVLSETPTTLFTTELDNLSSNASILSAAVDNSQGQALDGYTQADLELVWAYGAGPSTGVVSAWILRCVDGTNFEDGSAGVLPGRAPDVVFAPIYGTANGQRQVQSLNLPPGRFRVLLRNDGAGQAFSASNTPVSFVKSLKMRVVTRELV